MRDMQVCRCACMHICKDRDRGKLIINWISLVKNVTFLRLKVFSKASEILHELLTYKNIRVPPKNELCCLFCANIFLFSIQSK